MSKPKTGPALLTVPQAAADLSTSQDTVRRLIRDGVIPVVKVGGKPKSRIRIRRCDLDQLLAEGYHPATTGPLAPRS
jgi:excisionase family DNA binding protein